MNEETENPFPEKASYETVRRYEEMLRNNTRYYFDVDEFEDIIDYYMDSNRLSNALDVAQYASRQHPLASGILIRKAQILIDKGQPLEAVRICREVSRIEPDNPELYIAQGIAYNHLGDFKSAVRAFDHGLSLVTENKSEVLYHFALSLQQVNQYKIAMKYLQQAIDLDPENLTVLYDMAFCCERMEMLEKSVDYYRRYLDLDPYSENVWYNLGVVYNRLDNFEKAIEAYDYAIAIDETYSSAYYNKANTLANMNLHREAIEVYKEFLYHEEDTEQVLCYIGECYEKLGEMDEALVYYRRVIKMNEKFADAWLGIGLVMFEKHMYYESLYYVRRAILLEEDNEDGYYALGRIYTKLEFYDDAISSYEKALELDHYDEESWINLADLYFHLKKQDKAMETLEEGLLYNKDSGLMQVRYAVYLVLNGEVEKGGKVLHQAVKTDRYMSIEFDIYFPGEPPEEIRKILNKYRP